jgi:hypothetical protein
MEFGIALTRWFVWVSFACYLVAGAVQWSRPASTTGSRLARWFWTAACMLMIAHVGCAFGFVHRWSHAAAYQETARQTAELTGIRSGFGLYINYGMLLVWLGHVILIWCSSPAAQRFLVSANRWIHAFFGFMWFNATVVFGDGFNRWGGIVGFALLLLIRTIVRPRGNGTQP